MSQRFHLPKLQPKRTMWRGFAEHSWAGPSLRCCHHHTVDCPMSQRFHLPKLQPKRTVWRGFAEHSWADPSLWCCHHHLPDCPMWQSCHLQRTTCGHCTICSYFGMQCNSNAVSTLKARSWRVFVGSKRRPSGAASLRKSRSKDCRASIFKSRTVLVGTSDTAAQWPLGNNTFSRNGCRILFILKGLHLVLSGSIANVASPL